MELYGGEYFEAQFTSEESWAALSPSHSKYSSFVSDETMLSFPVEISENSVGTVKGGLVVIVTSSLHLT